MLIAFTGHNPSRPRSVQYLSDNEGVIQDRFVSNRLDKAHGSFIGSQRPDGKTLSTFPSLGLLLLSLLSWSSTFPSHVYTFINLRISEVHLFYNLLNFYWHFLEILWLFIFLFLYSHCLSCWVNISNIYLFPCFLLVFSYLLLSLFLMFDV